MQVNRSSPSVVATVSSETARAQPAPATGANNHFLQQQADLIASQFRPTPGTQLRQIEILTEQARLTFRNYMLENHVDLSDATPITALIER